jgi:hypothetical protein
MKYSVIMTLALAVTEAAAMPQDTGAAPAKPTISNVPKLGGSPIAFGPAPTGCNAYEIFIGEVV